MTRGLRVQQVGPGVTIQDLGRPGYLSFGLSRGGAADRLALAEGAALLGQAKSHAVLEMAGFGGRFEATEDLRVALTGAPMRATIDDAPAAWSASHLVPTGSVLNIGPATAGVYGYLNVGGGFETPVMLGARSAHLAAGLGAVVGQGDLLPVGEDKGRDIGLILPVEDRFKGGEVRVVPGLQTKLFAEAERARFEATLFKRDARGNRMGVRCVPDGEGFHSEAGLSILSEVIVPGDIQITGDGTPFVLLSECQTTGGYPRIGSVLPCDLPRVAQAPPGAELRFRFLSLDEGDALQKTAATAEARLKTQLKRLLRDPREAGDLLAHQLISGVTSGRETD